MTGEFRRHDFRLDPGLAGLRLDQPGVGFGEYGEGYVRVGLVENEHRIRQAARNVKKFLANADEILGRAHNTMAAQ